MLSFVREFGDDIVLCVNNLSRFPQPVELDLRPWEGAQPIELTRRRAVPARSASCRTCSPLAGHGFYWLRIPRVHQSTAEPPRRAENPPHAAAPSQEGGLRAEPDPTIAVR